MDFQAAIKKAIVLLGGGRGGERRDDELGGIWKDKTSEASKQVKKITPALKLRQEGEEGGRV